MFTIHSIIYIDVPVFFQKILTFSEMPKVSHLTLKVLGERDTKVGRARRFIIMALNQYVMYLLMYHLFYLRNIN